MDHTFHTCKYDECRICNSGLAWCLVCGGAEGSLTTECCGRMITEEEEYRIYNLGKLDFKNGVWVEEPNYPRYAKGDKMGVVVHAEVYINGTRHKMLVGPDVHHISYDDICTLAHRDPEQMPSVSVAYHNHDGLRDCILHKGQSAEVRPGMVVNCFVTGNA